MKVVVTILKVFAGFIGALAWTLLSMLAGMCITLNGEYETKAIAEGKKLSYHDWVDYMAEWLRNNKH